MCSIRAIDPLELPPWRRPGFGLIESLIELQQRWRDAGSRLLVLDGDPVTKAAAAGGEDRAESVVWNRDVEPYARERTVRWPNGCRWMAARWWWIGISCRLPPSC